MFIQVLGEKLDLEDSLWFNYEFFAPVISQQRSLVLLDAKYSLILTATLFL